MNRKEEKIYSTGEFSTYFGIKKDTLLYYDRIGLFHPAGIQENGYRYYTASQISTFGTLLSLREMDVPIREIQDYFCNPSPERLERMASTQVSRIDQEIKKLKDIRKLFLKVIDATQEALSAELDRVSIQSLPASRFLYSSPNTSDTDSSLQQWWKIYKDFLIETNAVGVVYIGSVISLRDLEKGQFKRVERLFLPSFNRAGSLREAGTYAVLYHKGDFDSLPKVYPHLIQEIKNQGFLIAGDAYEDYLIEELAAPHPGEYITKITIRVAPQQD